MKNKIIGMSFSCYIKSCTEIRFKYGPFPTPVPIGVEDQPFRGREQEPTVLCTVLSSVENGDMALPCSELPFGLNPVSSSQSCSQRATGDNMPLVNDTVLHLSSLDVQIWTEPWPEVWNRWREGQWQSVFDSFCFCDIIEYGN